MRHRYTVSFSWRNGISYAHICKLVAICLILNSCGIFHMYAAVERRHDKRSLLHAVITTDLRRSCDLISESPLQFGRYKRLLEMLSGLLASLLVLGCLREGLLTCLLHPYGWHIRVHGDLAILLAVVVLLRDIFLKGA